MINFIDTSLEKEKFVLLLGKLSKTYNNYKEKINQQNAGKMNKFLIKLKNLFLKLSCSFHFI